MKDNAMGLDLKNNMKPDNYNAIFYGNQKVPHPTNHAAKKVNPKEVIDSILCGK